MPGCPKKEDNIIFQIFVAEEEMASLTNAGFPLEILELIFVNLSPADLKSAVAVCRR